MSCNNIGIDKNKFYYNCTEPKIDCFRYKLGRTFNKKSIPNFQFYFIPGFVDRIIQYCQ